MGCDHVCVHHQLDLPRNSQDLSVRNVQARNRLMGLWAQDRNLRRIANGPDREFMTTVIFACPKCGLADEVTQVQVPTKKLGRFDCVDCGATIHSWYGVFDYSGCRAVRMDRGRGRQRTRMLADRKSVMALKSGSVGPIHPKATPGDPDGGRRARRLDARALG